MEDYGFRRPGKRPCQRRKHYAGDRGQSDRRDLGGSGAAYELRNQSGCDACGWGRLFLRPDVSGRGGSVCGISSVDYYDASDNETTTKGYFDDNRWYHIRVRVTADKIQCWIDNKQYVDLETTGKRLGVRIDVIESKPLGIASWHTTAAIRNIRLTKLAEAPAELSSR
ncbi:MAG: family 16 glycoside hydrolase [Planctomycetota bacterium]